MLWSLLATFVIAVVHGASAAGLSACITFDSNWNMLALGFNGKDYNLGTQASWGSPVVTDITTRGRPPFNSVNTTCYLSLFDNLIYILNADVNSPYSVYVYDVHATSWSNTSQIPNDTVFDTSNFAAILLQGPSFSQFFGYSNGNFYTNQGSGQWLDAGSVNLSNTPTLGAGYQPVMAVAQNNMYFLGISGLPAGSIKFIDLFTLNAGIQTVQQSYGSFPSTHGGAASIFLEDGVPKEFAFVPDDGSSTYVINVESNTTKTLTGPPQADPFATYSASTSALVQLTSNGKVAFLPYNPNTTTSGGTWTSIIELTSLFTTSPSSSSNPSQSESSPTGSSPSKNSAVPGSTSNSNSDKVPIGAVLGGVIGGLVFIGLAVLFVFLQKWIRKSRQKISSVGQEEDHSEVVQPFHVSPKIPVIQNSEGQSSLYSQYQAGSTLQLGSGVIQTDSPRPLSPGQAASSSPVTNLSSQPILDGAREGSILTGSHSRQFGEGSPSFQLPTTQRVVRYADSGIRIPRADDGVLELPPEYTPD